MSDGDTRKVNEKVLQDPGAMWVPMEKFRSFSRADRIWVIAGIVTLIVIINIVFGFGNSASTPSVPG